jgi:polygalacturonase
MAERPSGIQSNTKSLSHISVLDSQPSKNLHLFSMNPRLSLVFAWRLAAIACFALASLLSAADVSDVPAAAARPSIPALRVSLTDFGGVPDGRTLNSKAFSQAFDTLAKKGGGTLVVPPGIWLTGPIAFVSRVTLHLETGALTQFSRDRSLYPQHTFDARGEKFTKTMAPLFAEKCEDIAITGDGVIDGGGDAWRYVKKSKVTENLWRELLASGGQVDESGKEWWPDANGGRNRPEMLRFQDCRRILLQGVTFRNSPMWTLHPWLSEDVTIENVKILNDRWAQNSDAIDIDSCRRVVVRGCVIDTGDDGICIKSGINEVGRRIGVPTEDVLVEDCVVYEGHGGFTIGSEMSGSVRNILVRNCTFIGTALGLRFKTARGRGGIVENIRMRDIFMTDIEGDAINLTSSYFQKDEANKPAPVDEGTPEFRNLLFENIIANRCEGAIAIRGLPEKPLLDITLRNVEISAKEGVKVAFADGLVFDNVRVGVTEGKLLEETGVQRSKISVQSLGE